MLANASMTTLVYWIPAPRLLSAGAGFAGMMVTYTAQFKKIDFTI
jgi:hypothetical protein